MMTFYVEKNEKQNGDHMVHTSQCPNLPPEDQLVALGNFAGCDEAVAQAKEIYYQSNGCHYCSNACHMALD